VLVVSQSKTTILLCYHGQAKCPVSSVNKYESRGRPEQKGKRSATNQAR
jgi:hypothetical protein